MNRKMLTSEISATTLLFGVVCAIGMLLWLIGVPVALIYWLAG